MNNTKQHFLFIILLGIIVLTACGKKTIDYLVIGEFQYTNKTTQPISIEVYGSITGSNFNTYTLPPNDTLVLKVSALAVTQGIKESGVVLAFTKLTGDANTVILLPALMNSLFTRQYHFDFYISSR